MGKKKNADTPPPISELTVSRSQILEYLNCGYRWDLAYRRGVTTATVREALDGGSAVHRAMKEAIRAYAHGIREAYVVSAKRGAATWAREERKRRGTRLTVEQDEQIRVLTQEAVPIAVRALEHFELHSWEVATWLDEPLFEREMIVPLAPWKGFRTIPDLVARPHGSPKGTGWWLIDWKTRSSFESDDAEEINLQFASMQYVMAKVAPEILVEGSILWQIKSKAPAWPKANKDGSMSRALIATDWDTYRKALLDAKLKPADYEAEMRPKLESIEWWRTIPQHRALSECIAVWQQVVEPAADRMARDPQVIRRFVHQAFGCSGCWARQYCLAELRGDDTEFLLATDYIDTRTPRPRREMGSTTFVME